MTVFARLLPLPAVSAAVLFLWMVLAASPSLGQFLLGTALAILLPLASKPFWPDSPRIARPWTAARLAIKVLADILIANWQVARLVVGPVDRLRPQFVEVPIEISHPFVATLLGSIVSLTPGTVSIEIDMAQKLLLVHALDVADEDEMIATIKARYEVPLKEIFAC